MIISWFERQESKDGNFFVAPKSNLIFVATDPCGSEKFKENFTVTRHTSEHPIPEEFERGHLNDYGKAATSMIMRKRTVVEETTSSHYEYKRVGLFKKEPVLCMDTHKTTKTVQEPLTEGLETLGRIKGNGELWFGSGYARIVMDGKTGLPKLDRNPQTVDEAIKLIHTDPRYIEIMNPTWEFLDDHAVKRITLAVGESFEKFLKYQNDFGIEYTEQEKQNRDNFENQLLKAAKKFADEYKKLSKRASLSDRISDGLDEKPEESGETSESGDDE